MLSYLHMLPKDHVDFLDPHRYIPAGHDDLRAPCPALNTLANHGYIPRDGRNLNFIQLVRVQCEVFNMSIPLAASLAFEAVFLCGNGLTVDLRQLRKHNAIEHDASLSRDDVDLTGNSWSVDPKLVAKMIAEYSSPEGLTFKDMARVRVKREKMLANVTKRLDWTHNKIALGEACLTIGIWGLGGGDDMTKRVVPISRLRSFFLDEKLPDGWQRPLHQLGFLTTLDMGGKLRAEMDKILEEEEQQKQQQLKN